VHASSSAFYTRAFGVLLYFPTLLALPPRDSRIWICATATSSRQVIDCAVHLLRVNPTRFQSFPYLYAKDGKGIGSEPLSNELQLTANAPSYSPRYLGSFVFFSLCSLRHFDERTLDDWDLRPVDFFSRPVLPRRNLPAVHSRHVVLFGVERRLNRGSVQVIVLRCLDVAGAQGSHITLKDYVATDKTRSLAFDKQSGLHKSILFLRLPQVVFPRDDRSLTYSNRENLSLKGQALRSLPSISLCFLLFPLLKTFSLGFRSSG